MATGISEDLETGPGAGEQVAAAAGAPLGARAILATLSLSMLLSSFATSSVNVALPGLAAAFDASFGEVQWIVLAYLLAITALIVGVGRLGDLAGRRRLMLAGIALFTGASLLCAASPTLWLLVAARCAQGAGAAAMMALTLTFVSDAARKAGRAMGLLGAMSAIGTALGPSLGGLLVGGGGWRAIFLINVPLGLLTLVLARHCLPPDDPGRRAAARNFDLAGTLLLAMTLAAYALAMTTGRGDFGAANLALLIAGTLLLALFAAHEARAASPLIDFAGFRGSGLGGGLATSGMVAAVLIATLVVGPFHLTVALGLSASGVGLVLSAGPICAALAAIPAGRLTDRFGARRAAIAGMAGVSAGSFLLAALPHSWGLFGYVAPIVLITSAYSLFQTANNSFVMSTARPDQRGVVSGMLNLSRNLGFVTGTTVLGAVFAISSGSPDIASADASAVAGAMRITFAVAGSLMILALIIAACNRTRAPTCGEAFR